MFASAGFDFYSSDPQLLTSTLTSPILSPLSADDTSSIHLLDLGTSITSATTTISPENGAVLTRSRSSTEASQTFSSLSKLHLTDIQQNDSEAVESDADGIVTVNRLSSSRSQSHSPSSCDVQVLHPDLTCIGLADDSSDMWTLKIMKLVAFPDMIPGVASYSGSSSRSHSMPSAHPDSRPPSLSPEVLLHPQPTEDDIALDPTSDSETESGGSRSDATTQVGPESPKIPRRGYSDSPVHEVPQDRLWDDADDASSEGDSSDGASFHSASPDVIQSPVEAGTGELRLGPTGTYIPRPRLPHLNTVTSASPRRRQRQRAASEADSHSLRYSKPDQTPLVPFWSFTRTPEGSSLMGSVALLAALFPPSERHMVMCSGELDIQDSRAASPEKVTESLETIDEDGALESGVGDGEDGGFELPESEGTMKCLQIDLRKFGLGAFLLVTSSPKTPLLNESFNTYLFQTSTVSSAGSQKHSKTMASTICTARPTRPPIYSSTKRTQPAPKLCFGRAKSQTSKNSPSLGLYLISRHSCPTLFAIRGLSSLGIPHFPHFPCIF